MSVHNDVLKGLKEYLTQNSAYKPFVKTFASGSDYPMVVFEKVGDIERSSDMQRKTTISTITYEINIFAKNKTVGTTNVLNINIANEIESHIKNYMGKKLGMKRTYDKPSPNVDSSIYRITMRYTVSLNETKNYFI
ncbi:MAG: hypothetical protein RR585_06790 [Coprobacillus sp.]